MINLKNIWEENFFCVFIKKNNFMDHKKKKKKITKWVVCVLYVHKSIDNINKNFRKKYKYEYNKHDTQNTQMREIYDASYIFLIFIKKCIFLKMHFYKKIKYYHTYNKLRRYF